MAFGIRSTGRLITGAALIMVAVFWGFAAGDLVALQQMGFGLGLAVLLDATIVRMVLVPASMRLLGSAIFIFVTGDIVFIKFISELYFDDNKGRLARVGESMLSSFRNFYGLVTF